MVAVGLARVGVGVKIRTPAYTLIYPHLDQQMIIMTLIMGMLVMVVKYHQMLSTTVHKTDLATSVEKSARILSSTRGTKDRFKVRVLPLAPSVDPLSGECPPPHTDPALRRLPAVPAAGFPERHFVHKRAAEEGHGGPGPRRAD